MNNPDQPDALNKQLMEMAERVKRLEDEVFKPGPPGFGERLKELGDELAALQKKATDHTNQIHQLDRKIDQVIRIVAELRNMIEKGGSATATMTA